MRNKNSYMKTKILLITILFSSNFLFAQTNLSGFYPSSTISGLRFGSATAIHENTIVISSATSPFPPVTTGYVYVFNQTNQSITQEAYFYPSDALSNDQFGKAVAVFEDFIAVGSPLHDEGFSDSGAVYLYKKVNNNWEFFQKITATDASANKQFGSFVKIQGNSLFVSAPNDTNSIGIGSVYVYTFNETEWIFNQKLTIANSIKLGEKIEIEGNYLVVSDRLNEQKTKYHTFIFDTNWIYNDSTLEFGNLEENIKDFSFDGQKLYITAIQMSSQFLNKVYILNRVNNSWVNESILPMNFDDFVIGKIAVSGNNMLVGYEFYFLQLSRKFPVFYYKKIENEWQMQTYFYGEGQSNMDDYLGNSISMFESNVVLGAYNEGGINTGKAYSINLENLSIPTFDKNVISIYPNPTNNSITIENQSSNQVGRYELFSITGKLLYSVSNQFSTLSLDHFQSGIYLLKISFENDSYETHKIIKK